MALPRMRTAAGVLAEIEEADPKTEITLHFIRHIIHTEQVPVVHVGRKKLVDVDALLEFIRSGSQQKATQATGRIRKVKV